MDKLQESDYAIDVESVSKFQFAAFK